MEFCPNILFPKPHSHSAPKIHCGLLKGIQGTEPRQQTHTHTQSDSTCIFWSQDIDIEKKTAEAQCERLKI